MPVSVYFEPDLCMLTPCPDDDPVLLNIALLWATYGSNMDNLKGHELSRGDLYSIITKGSFLN